MVKLEFAELQIGMKVQDNDGNIGTIKKCKDVHNILVKFITGTGGYGFYCLDPECPQHYDPLYKYE